MWVAVSHSEPIKSDLCAQLKTFEIPLCATVNLLEFWTKLVANSISQIRGLRIDVLKEKIQTQKPFVSSEVFCVQS